MPVGEGRWNPLRDGSSGSVSEPRPTVVSIRVERRVSVRRILLALLASLLVAACSGGVAQEEYDHLRDTADQAVAEVSNLTDQLAQAEADLANARGAATEAADEVEDLEAQLAELDTRIETLEGELRDEQSHSTDLEEQLAAAEQEIEDLLFAFDDEIQAAKAALLNDAEPLACGLGVDAVEKGWTSPPSTDSILDGLEGLDTAVGFDVAQLVDLDELAAIAAECFQVERTQRVLYGPHGDGFHTVGEEIGAGLWRSNGSGDSCYWARLNSNQDILDNHFGSAGGSVRIRPSDYEVRFEDCGTWEYVGP